MIWIASTEKDTAVHTADTAREKRLLDAADQCRVNSGFKSQAYSVPVHGVIFLRVAEVRLAARRASLLKQSETARPSRRSLGEGGCADDPAAYHAEARFDCLLNRPEAENIGTE